MTRIPNHVLQSGYRKKVHIEGLGTNTCFYYYGTDPDGFHRCGTQWRKFRTNKPICYTLRNLPYEYKR